MGLDNAPIMWWSEDHEWNDSLPANDPANLPTKTFSPTQWDEVLKLEGGYIMFTDGAYDITWEGTPDHLRDTFQSNPWQRRGNYWSWWIPFGE